MLAVACGSLAVGAGGAVLVPEAWPPHPRLLFRAQDLPGIRERIATESWAKAQADALHAQADDWLKREVTLPDRGSQWWHYYSCPQHGARLRTEGPKRHVCPIDRQVFTGYPYDDVVLAEEHGRYAGAIRTLGIVFQLTGRAEYAAKAKAILLAYAVRYASYPLHDIRGEAKVGGGKVGPQTLDESTWLIRVVQGADGIWDTLTPHEQRQVEAGLLRPATDLIRAHRMGIHNIQCWKNSAVGLTGLLLGDHALVEEAINGPAGYMAQMAKGVSADGPWFEGAWGYHFYTLAAVVSLTEGARHSGIDLYGPELKRMLDAPVAMAMPDLVLPAFNDSHAVNVIEQSSLYETALARYQEERYRSVIARGNRRCDSALLHGVRSMAAPPPRETTSQNFVDSGNAILCAGSGREAAWLGLDYGPHGGGHGHPDKLGFVLYGRGRVLAPDPGTANYGVPIQGGWFRTTLAHNTLTVDERSQERATGKCHAFLATNGFSAVMADAGNIADGVRFTRTVALLGTDLFVFIDQVQSKASHTYDLAYHNIGRFAAVPPGTPCSVPDKPGYSYLRDARSQRSEASLRLVLDAGGERVGWMMAGGDPTTFITATGVGQHTEDRVPMVLARRTAADTCYVWCVNLGDSGTVQLEPEPVQRADGTSLPMADAAAVRILTAHGTWRLLANPTGSEIRLGGETIDRPLTVTRVK